MSPKDENGKKKRLSSPGQSRRDGHNKKSIEQSIKCETQRNPWISDQCVPVLPNRKLVIKSEPNETLNDSTDTITYTQYIDGNYIVTESIEGEGANTEDAQTYIAYETVVENNETIENSEIDSSQIKYSESEEYNSTYHDTTGMNETVEYIDGEAVEYITDFNETDGSGCDVAVQTSQNKQGHSFVPVFDVYMKDGNVTGFVVNEEYIKSAGVEKAVQTNGDCLASDVQSQADSATASQDQSGEMNELADTSETVLQDVEISYQSSDTYTKHEYIHKYNIDRYMTQPNFPKYIQTLAKQTYTDVLQMFTNVYKEKAIFKMTTTQKGKEGNTKIWYLLNARRIRRNNPTDEERGTKERLGNNLKDIFVLREKVKALKRQNKELLTRNKYLEDVALGVSKM